MIFYCFVFVVVFSRRLEFDVTKGALRFKVDIGLNQHQQDLIQTGHQEGLV